MNIIVAGSSGTSIGLSGSEIHYMSKFNTRDALTSRGRSAELAQEVSAWEAQGNEVTVLPVIAVKEDEVDSNTIYRHMYKSIMAALKTHGRLTHEKLIAKLYVRGSQILLLNSILSRMLTREVGYDLNDRYYLR